MTDSYAAGPTDVPLLEETIGAALRRTAAAHAASEALVEVQTGRRWTWAQLDAAVDDLARGLLDSGLEVGDRLGIWAPNSADWTLTQLATARIGVLLVTINPAYRTSELEFVLRQSGCRWLVAAPSFKTSDYRAMVSEVRGSCPALERVVFLGDEDWTALLAGGSGDLELRERALQNTEAINLQYTSGTTGFPKGATLSHRNILNNGYFVGQLCGYTSADRICIPVPFYHCFGMVMGNLAAVTHGASRVIPAPAVDPGATLSHHNILNNGYFVGEFCRYTTDDRVCIPVPFYHCFGMVLGNLACTTHGACMVVPCPAFDPAAVLETVAAERCTSLYGVPTMFVAELNHPDFDDHDLRSLRTGIMAGSPCPREIMKQVIARMHMEDVTICYGMTETSPVSTQTGPDDDIEQRVSTVGRVHPHVEVKIVDPDDLRTVVPRGVSGELCTRGYSVMLGYWNDDERTDEVIDAGRWMHTGDLATMDDGGYVQIVGRIKDMIIRGGENVYPREIEEFLYEHPAVADVAVVGVPDPTYGEQVLAWVQLADDAELTEDELREHCRDSIAHFKVPRYVQFVDAFPMTVTGKIQKYKIREQAVADLGLDDG